jgi:hypothetical protein
MNALKLYIAGAVVVGSIATPIIIRQNAQLRLQETVDSMKEQSQQLAALSAENEQLSNQVAALKREPAFSAEQESELLQLRGQIGQLRRAAKETENLRARNQKLLAAAESSATARRASASSGQSTADYWVKDQLTFSGYANPESALKTAFWAANNGDVRTMLECMTPDARAGMEREWQKDGKSEADAAAELKAMGTSLAAPSSAFRLLNEQDMAPDEKVANISFEGEGKARQFVLRKIGDEWKIERMLFAGEEPSQ